MLTIRNQQLEMFREKQEQKRLDDYFITIKRYYPEAAHALGNNTVNEWIAAGREQADLNNIKSPANVERYIHLMFLLNERDLDTSPKTSWVKRILGWQDATEDFKVTSLEKRTQAEMVEQIQQQQAEEQANTDLEQS